MRISDPYFRLENIELHIRFFPVAGLLASPRQDGRQASKLHEFLRSLGLHRLYVPRPPEYPL